MATEASSAGAGAGAAYEEERRKRILENQKHLEDLGITKMAKGLVQAIKQQTKSTRASTRPRKKFEATMEVRRSSRARTTPVSYKDDFPEVDNFVRHRRVTKGPDNARAYTGRISSRQQQKRAFKRAGKLQDSLDSDNPSFVKTMVRSHVSGCFWLGLPSSFCKDHLPPKKCEMVLEDEEGAEVDAIYIGNRTGLSGGWSSFSVHHNLEDGDSLVFELAEPDRFKIYICKSISSSRAIPCARAKNCHFSARETKIGAPAAAAKPCALQISSSARCLALFFSGFHSRALAQVERALDYSREATAREISASPPSFEAPAR